MRGSTVHVYHSIVIYLGLRDGACASSPHSPHHIYLYGGYGGKTYKDQDSLYHLSLQNLQWTKLPSGGDDSPMPKWGCGMVQYNGSLYVFGGYCGQLPDPTYPGAQFREDRFFGPVAGYTNELHVFNLNEGKECSLHCIQGCLMLHVYIFLSPLSLLSSFVWHLEAPPFQYNNVKP